LILTRETDSTTPKAELSLSHNPRPHPAAVKKTCDKKSDLDSNSDLDITTSLQQERVKLIIIRETDRTTPLHLWIGQRNERQPLTSSKPTSGGQVIARDEHRYSDDCRKLSHYPWPRPAAAKKNIVAQQLFLHHETLSEAERGV